MSAVVRPVDVVGILSIRALTKALFNLPRYMIPKMNTNKYLRQDIHAALFSNKYLCLNYNGNLVGRIAQQSSIIYKEIEYGREMMHHTSY